jgi:predicted TIM-barrel fold metal-dependent hydrolase
VSPERLKAMDEQGIDVEALSINPIFWYKAERDPAAEVVKLQNEKLAEICAKEPERFVVLGTNYPFPWTKVAVDHILGSPGFSDADKAAMLGETAAKLLGIRV